MHTEQQRSEADDSIESVEDRRLSAEIGWLISERNREDAENHRNTAFE